MVAIDFARDGKGGLLASGSYAKISGDFTTKLPTDVVQSSPFEYLSGGSKQDNSLFTYSTGYVTDTPFSGWADSDNGNIFNNKHYFMQISGLDEYLNCWGHFTYHLRLRQLHRQGRTPCSGAIHPPSPWWRPARSWFLHEKARRRHR